MSKVEQTAETDERGLGDEMFRVQQNTLDDGLARGRITDIEVGDDTVTLTYDVLTTGETETLTLDKPRTWARSYRFVRLVEWCGYNAASVEQIAGELVPLTLDADGDWQLDFERLPGDALIDQQDYYYGVARGTVATVLFMAATSVIGWYTGWFVVYTQPLGTFDTIGVASLLGVVVLALAYYLYRPADDRREQVTFRNMYGRSD